ncbi:MAG: Bacterial inner membrane protein [Idiomarinaceae bacterium HL-53]|nr:MAG: Bacterial inner membrane protein [Idiomarinaceae bacterium HL-53]CUS49073.1 inner membrane protein [Idiomarinaceae bacterium HL-53]
MDVWVYLLGAGALIVNFIAYRAETANNYRIISALALGLLSAHFFMQGALAGGIGLAIGSIRNIVSLRYTQTPVLVGFVFINVAFCIWEWLVLESPAILFIAYASALVFTVGTIVLKSAEAIRKWFIVAELLGLIYAALVGSVFGVLFNISNLTSIVVKLVQESKKTARLNQ